jgi:hypothetical protein
MRYNSAVPPGLALLLFVISGCDGRRADQDTTLRSTADSAAVASAAAAAALAELRADTPADAPLRTTCTAFDCSTA